MNSDKLKKLTVLILTYNRQKEIKEKIKYLSKFKFNILIVDGSPKSISKSIFRNFRSINYHHYPTEDYHERIFYARKYIKTKYVKIESDNDYFPPSSMIKSVNILDSNRNISAVFGKCALYSIFQEKVYIKQLFINHQSIDHDDIYERCQKYMQYYSPALYHAVCRTKIFKKNINLWKKCKKIYKQNFHLFAEIALPLLCLINGKVKCINSITWIRADDDIKKRENYIGIKKLIGKAANYRHFLSPKLLKLFNSGYFDNFFLLLDKEISNKLKDKDSVIKLKKVYFNYVSRSAKFKKLNFVLSNIIKFFIFILPKYVKKKIRFSLRINGPSIEEIVNYRAKVNYKFFNPFS